MAVLDEAGVFEGLGIKDEGNVYVDKQSKPLDSLKSDVRSGLYDGVVYIEPIRDLYSKEIEVQYFTSEGLTLDVEKAMRDRLREAIRDYKIATLGLDARSLDALKFDTEIKSVPLDESVSSTSLTSGAIGAALGTFMGFVMYLTIFIYGMMVMRSVMEEKTTRIVEVMISSVRPFELMMGKIVGVGLVGLTQVLVWVILIPVLVLLSGLIFGFDVSPEMSQASMAAQGVDPEEAANVMETFMAEVNSLNWWAILPLFLMYFLGGYFMYASMFAAVGSAMGDDMGEGQALTIPITIPVVLSIYIMFAVVQAPNSTLALWSSQFPLFSPIVMPARLAFEPPFWQVLLSISLLIGTAVLFVWLSGRIYRTAILLYGKKIGFKEMGRWLRRAN